MLYIVFFWFYILSTQRCLWGCIRQKRHNWREDSQNRPATAAYTCVCSCMNISSWIKWRVLFLIIYFIYLSLDVCCYNNEIYIFYFFIYSSLTVCCYNNEIKYAVGVGVIIVLTFGFYIVYTHRCWWGCIFYGQHIWRQDIVVPIVTTYASRYKQRYTIV